MRRYVETPQMDKILSLSKRRGLVFQSSEIYGGINATWDYGPLGVELKRNLKDLWWSSVVQQRDDVVGLDAAILMHPEVWVSSGHVASFSDPLVECRECHQRYREDQIESTVRPAQCPDCGGELTDPRQFSLMFKTFMGPVEDTANQVYLRPETAQGIFVNFANVLTASRRKLPFGIAQIGKAFRNEITPGNFTFRTREFEQMEIEYFVKPGTDDQWLQSWLDDRFNWYTKTRHPPREPETPASRPRRTGPLRQGYLRHRVPLPLGLGRTGGHRQSHRLRPAQPRHPHRPRPHFLRRGEQGTHLPLCHRTIRRRRPRDPRVPAGLLRRGARPSSQARPRDQ